MKQSERVEAVLRRLPVLPDREATIAKEALRLAITSISKTNDLPRAQETGTRKAVSELVTLAKAARRLRKIARKMHRTSLAQLEAIPDAPPPLLLAHDMAMLSTACETAVDTLRAQQHVTAPKGRPIKNGAAIVTREAISAYQRLTGKVATITVNPDNHVSHAPFLDFLSELFEALDIDASAESQARAALYS